MIHSLEGCAMPNPEPTNQADDSGGSSLADPASVRVHPPHPQWSVVCYVAIVIKVPGCDASTPQEAAESARDFTLSQPLLVSLGGIQYPAEFSFGS